MNLPKPYHELALPCLPVEDCLKELLQALRSENAAVLVAPPGAGKTSRVPLALLDEPWNTGKRILVLEPRRIAARATAEHMASLLNEQAGETVGYRVRMDSRVGPDTRIEFVTEGVFTRMILDDPELSGIGCICFDEFHERNLEGDLGLALAIDVQASLREDLRILPMSATLDGAAVAGLLKDAGVITSQGRTYPVEVRYMPRKTENRLEDEMASAIRKALRTEDGSLLCFLPGQGEILRTIERLGNLAENIDIHALYGAMKPGEQRAAIKPAPEGRRKVVLATSIAQTSLTLDGVTLVIDSGLIRVPRHEPATGLNRLETVRASKAAINQRAGRAGRTQPGICIRLWHEGQTASLPDQEKPEITDAELGGLVLGLADWGVNDPDMLSWLDKPPRPAWEIACRSLRALGALDEENRITPSGKALRKMPLPPRLAHMVIMAGRFGEAEIASRLAQLIAERGAGGRDIDLSVRLENLTGKKDPVSSRILASAASIAKIAMSVPDNSPEKPDDVLSPRLSPGLSPGVILSFAWPERIGRRMGPASPQRGQEGLMEYLLANGRRAILDGLSPLAREEWLAICEVQGSAASARILSAASLTKREIETFHPEVIVRAREVSLDNASGNFRAHIVTRLGSIVLSRESAALEADDDIPGKITEHLRSVGLEALLAEDVPDRLRSRLAFLHQNFPDRFKPVDDKALLKTLDEWLLPLLPGSTGPCDVTPSVLCEGLKLYAGYENMAAADRLAPQKLALPGGRSHRLEYSAEAVILRARVQEFYGLTSHPAICDGKIAITLELLSPAMRPVQKTLDIAGFWEGSWQDVRKDMRGRYPKHFWPENPANEKASIRTRSGN